MLKSKLKDWQAWGLLEPPRLIRTFDSGKNHHTGLIESDGNRFVLKVFKHSFKRTIEAETWASAKTVSPRLQFAAKNVSIYDFIEDQGFSSDRISSLGRALRRIHSSNALQEISPISDINTNFDLLGFCNTYLATASAQVHEWHRVLMPALLDFNQDSTPPVFCHNDLVVQNCLFEHDSIKFIDWEFAQRNNPWFDLAAIIHYFNLNNLQASEFLSSYHYGWDSKIEHSIFYSSQVAVLWCDLLWNIHNDGSTYLINNRDRVEQLRIISSQMNIILPS